ncbi:MAG: DUF5667 domain-containing protein [bacterium]
MLKVVIKSMVLASVAVLLIGSTVGAEEINTVQTDSSAGSIIGDSGVVASMQGESLDGKGSDAVNASDELVGVDVKEVTKMPSGFGLWWQGAKEKIGLTFTFDPVKKAEKRIKYAEQRMKYAEYIVTNAKDTKKQEWADQMIEKAKEHMSKVEENKEEWINNTSARKNQLLKNIATYQVRKDKALDRIEAKLPEEKLEKFRDMREKTIENTRKFMIELNKNTNIPEEVKTHLKAVKEKVEEKHRIITQFQVDKRAVMQKVKSGEPGAEDKLKELQEKRQEVIKTQVQAVKQQANPVAKPAVKKVLKEVKTQQKMENKVDAENTGVVNNNWKVEQGE